MFRKSPMPTRIITICRYFSSQLALIPTIYKPEQRSQLQPLHRHISCHRSEPSSLQHLLCCWQLQSSNFSSCSDTISISSEIHSLSEGHETWCLYSTAQRLLAKPYRVSSARLSLQKQPRLRLSPVLHLKSSVSPGFLSAWKTKRMGYSCTCLFHSW